MRRRIEPGKAFLLFLCAFIWGTAFVAQSVGNRYMGPITFQTARSVFAVAVLAPLVLVRRHFRVQRKAQGDVGSFHTTAGKRCLAARSAARF
ncbi:EamA family transporter [Lachnoclostridium sp. Marseille-P6806]|uniref:EamA family transporter n=1 Tax=Lachnoclostridium sp. Marseille-P6806 TaxID=2364793 RepID=UPI001F5FA7D7|nr:EamA family transporter [Lachnoclostridium sp. Marseille-P6806]